MLELFAYIEESILILSFTNLVFCSRYCLVSFFGFKVYKELILFLFSKTMLYSMQRFSIGSVYMAAHLGLVMSKVKGRENV